MADGRVLDARCDTGCLRDERVHSELLRESVFGEPAADGQVVEQLTEFCHRRSPPALLADVHVTALVRHEPELEPGLGGDGVQSHS